MALINSITNAMEHTTKLLAAIKAEDESLWVQLMEARGRAMATFEAEHRSADSIKISQCSKELDQLFAADKDLNKLCQKNLDSIKADFREKVTSGPQNSASGYNIPTHQACVSRKA